MATVARSASSGRSSRNARQVAGDAHNRDLGFLENFSSDDHSSQNSAPSSSDHNTWDEFSEGTSDAESDYDYEYEDKQRKNMIRRGVVYTVRNPPIYHKSIVLITTRLDY
jgi:hypothetical protein